MTGPTACRESLVSRLILSCIAFTVSGCAAEALADPGLVDRVAPLFQQYCFDCHVGEEAEADVDLEALSASASFDSTFKTWDKVVAMLESRKMPPDDSPQLSDADRTQLVALIRGEMTKAANARAGDPGQLVLRRLTSAEYAYTIEDLTGLDLDLESHFDSDAVGGEGFANIGDVQFVQDSTLERYLDAAKRVAAHAVIGAGPLHFYPDPGKSGFELSAIHRIQSIYRAHGFRTGAGEGGEAFGLNHYPNAFYVAWRYRHRDALGTGSTNLAQIAATEKISPRFATHVWNVLTAEQPSFPTSEIATRWEQLPAPAKDDPQFNERVRAACGELYDELNRWQGRLAEAAGDKEEAPVLTEATFQVSISRSFEAQIDWPEDLPFAQLCFSVTPAALPNEAAPVVIWKNPRVRFRQYDRRWSDERPLASLVAPDTAEQLGIGKQIDGIPVGTNDLVTTGTQQLNFDFAVPANARRAELLIDVQLAGEQSRQCVVRCAIAETPQSLNRRGVSGILGDPDSQAFVNWKRGVLEFARDLPQVSHREPAPSDRDPIPPPFDTTYNNPERDHFHYKVKYHRDDRFLVEEILDDQARVELDQAWTDLLASFEYHDIYLRFVAKKFGLDLGERTAAELDSGWIAALPDEPRRHVQRLVDEYQAVQAAMEAAEPGRVEDAVRFAAQAWRRPLVEDEAERLRAFYQHLRQNEQQSHTAAIRSLLVRILMAPAFLYRAEPHAGAESIAALSDWELASRLSYFLWSSTPDEELTRTASAGLLSDPEQLSRQAERMLRDAKARRFATEFFGQWFGFYRFDQYRGVDSERFPEFTDELKSAMYDEAVTFFEHIVREDAPVDDILFADYAFLNRSLARHYGVQGSSHLSQDIERVEQMRGDHRGGLLRLGAVLTVTSAPLRTSPVKRGDWILRRVIGTPVPPPPADAGSIPADDRRADGLSIRERLAAHRRNATCNNCHSRIDPLGFALENYDSLGRWRERYHDGRPIETAATLNNGSSISGPEGLHGYLKSRERQFHRTLGTRLLGYALGRAEAFSDRVLIDQMVVELESGDGRFSTLVKMIVTSPQFRYYRSGDIAQAQQAATSPRSKDLPNAQR